MNKSESKGREIVAAASEVAGSIVGASLGVIFAGPAGAIGGAIIGPVATKVLSRTCLDVYDRITGRGAARATAAAAFAVSEIKARIEAGEQLRNDGFFDASTSRSEADEILEGVMLKCRDTHEEKKAQFYGQLFASAALNPAFSAEYLNRVLVILGQLTYQQLCILELFASEERDGWRTSDFVDVDAQMSSETLVTLEQLFDLFRLTLVYRAGPPGSDPDSLKSSIFIMDPFQIIPTEVQLTRLGRMLVEALRLQNIPRCEVEALLEVLQ